MTSTIKDSILKFLVPTLDAVTLALMVRNNSTLLSADAALLAHPYMGRPMDYKVLLPDTKPFFQTTFWLYSIHPFDPDPITLPTPIPNPRQHTSSCPLTKTFLLLVRNDQELYNSVLGKSRAWPETFHPLSQSDSLLWTTCSCGTDPLVHYGRHFGRTVHALCTVNALIKNGILRMGELSEQPEESFTHE